MSFKRIEVLGFKSFADKLAIEFSDGITAIVGPNGCGKSNIGDAIRWVLGEQSSKNLRGSSMQDVIFKGAENRKGVSYCEVSLVFSNENKQFNLDYDEVVISRKLFRSGTSEYSLNHSPCLLKDITNLLHDCGIGRDGYSIIGQGKVEQIVASKPEDRRIVFEEAAGIAKFKERKVEAERKLEKTRENLALIENTVIELERQLLPMRSQAEKAKVYLELRDKLKYEEVNNYIYHYETANETKQRIADLIEGLKEQSQAKDEEVKSVVTKQNQSLEGIKMIDEQIQSLRDEVLRLTVEIEKSAGDKRVEQAKLKFKRDEANKLQRELVAKKAEFESLNKLLLGKQEEKSNNLDTLNSLRTQLNDLEQAYVGVVEQVKMSEQAISGSTAELQDAISKLSDIKSNVARLQAELDSAVNREKELDQKVGGLQLKLNEAQENMQISNNDKDQAESDKLEAWNVLQSTREEFAKSRGEEEQLRASLENNLASLSRMETRVKLLNEMQAEYEGYNGTVRRLLLDANKNSELKNLLVGVVGELIAVPSEISTAVEMALGAAVQNIVTQNEENAKRLVAYLKQHNYGRATFLPINSMKPRNLSDNYRSLLHTNGCLGVASELIKFDSKLSPVISGLLGSTVIVENMDTAVRLANNSHFGFKIVTLDGDIINPAGSITGGSKKAEINNLLSREQELESLTKALAEQRDLVAKQKAELQNKAEEIAFLSKKLDEGTQFLQECEVELAKKNEAFSRFSDEVALYKAELEELNQEKHNLSVKKESLINELNKNQVAPQIAVESSGGASYIDSLRVQRDEMNEKITQLKIDIATFDAQNNALKLDIERVIQEQEELSVEIDELNENWANIQQEIISAEQVTQPVDEATLDADRQKLESYKQKVSELEEVKQQLHDSLAKIEEERTRLTKEFGLIQERLYQEDAKLSQIDTTLENMESRILDDYDLTYLTAQNLKDAEFNPNGVNGRINDLKREISKLGNVNVNAIEDSKELETRYADLSTQLTDLKQAESDIMTVINELSSQMTEQFDTQFTKINENFSRIFRELFGGGKARLVLTSEDVLTAGVDIIAEPPGKALGNLSLLSGGEKSLTAIAILFAILKLRPMPFCLLDEIDAALDDANVERFAKYLHNFAGETQFIVITHRKPTMELADNLYGVTMENKGVSKVVSVKLSDALSNATAN